MSPLCQIQVPHLIETLRRLAGGENSASKEETELWRHIRAPRVARTWAKPNNEPLLIASALGLKTRQQTDKQSIA